MSATSQVGFKGVSNQIRSPAWRSGPILGQIPRAIHKVWTKFDVSSWNSWEKRTKDYLKCKRWRSLSSWIRFFFLRSTKLLTLWPFVGVLFCILHYPRSSAVEPALDVFHGTHRWWRHASVGSGKKQQRQQPSRSCKANSEQVSPALLVDFYTAVWEAEIDKWKRFITQFEASNV